MFLNQVCFESIVWRIILKFNIRILKLNFRGKIESLKFAVQPLWMSSWVSTSVGAWIRLVVAETVDTFSYTSVLKNVKKLCQNICTATFVDAFCQECHQILLTLHWFDCFGGTSKIIKGFLNKKSYLNIKILNIGSLVWKSAVTQKPLIIEQSSRNSAEYLLKIIPFYWVPFDYQKHKASRVGPVVSYWRQQSIYPSFSWQKHCMLPSEHSSVLFRNSPSADVPHS